MKKPTRPRCPKCGRGNPEKDGDIWHYPDSPKGEGKGKKHREFKVWSCKCGHTFSTK